MAPGHRLQVGLGRQGVVEVGVVGRAVHRHHLPAGGHEQVDRGRPHAAPGARDDGDRAHDGVDVATSAPTRPPPGRGRGRRAAPGLLRRSPPSDLPARRWTIPVAPLRHGDGAAAGRSAPCGRARPARDAPPRVDGQEQRRLGPAGVRVAPGRRPSPARPARRRPRPRSALDRDQRLLVAPVGVDEHHAGERAPGRAHQLHQQVGQDRMPDEQRPREVGVLAAGAVGDGRAPRPRPRSRPARPPATATAMRVSVSRGRCGPCCSSEPSGIASTGRGPGRLHLGPGGAGELHGLRRGPATGSGRAPAWAPVSASRPGRPWSAPPSDCGRRSIQRRQRRLAVAVHAFGVGAVEGQAGEELGGHAAAAAGVERAARCAGAGTLRLPQLDVNSADSRQTEGKPPGSRTLPARNWRSMTKGQAYTSPTGSIRQTTRPAPHRFRPSSGSPSAERWKNESPVSTPGRSTSQW